MLTKFDIYVLLVFCVVFSRSLFVLLYFFFLSLYWLSFFDLQLLIALGDLQTILERLNMTYNDFRRIHNTMTKIKRANNDVQNTAKKTKDRATQTSLKRGKNSCTSEGQTSPAPIVAPAVFSSECFIHSLHIQIYHILSTK